jgi:hypothetical protein
MKFYIVFCKNRKKFDKYVKVNRIRNKVVVDIKQQVEQIKSEEGQDFTVEKYKDYFNLLIYTKIVHSLRKTKDIYYIPNFDNENINISELFKIKNIFEFPVEFGSLYLYEDFNTDPKMQEIILNELHNFDTSQIIRDY